MSTRSGLRILLLLCLSTTVSNIVRAQRPHFEGLGRKLVDNAMATCFPRDVTNNFFGVFGSEQVIYEPYVVGGTRGFIGEPFRKCRWRDFDDMFVVQDGQTAANFAISDDARYRMGVVETNAQQATYDTLGVHGQCAPS